jgi:hypothetical protein
LIKSIRKAETFTGRFFFKKKSMSTQSHKLVMSRLHSAVISAFFIVCVFGLSQPDVAVSYYTDAGCQNLSSVRETHAGLKIGNSLLERM